MSRLLLITNDADYEITVVTAISAAEGDVTRVKPEVDVLAEITDETEVIVLGPGLELSEAVDMVRTLDRARPNLSVVLVAAPSVEVLSEAMRAGARDILSPHADAGEIRTVLNQAMDATRRLWESTPVGTSTPAAGHQQRTIVVVSAKGGSGKTFFSSNLGVVLAERTAGDVVLVDYDLQFGDLVYVFGLSPEATIADVALSSSDLDVTSIKSFLTPYNDDLFVMCAPDSPVDADSVGHNRMTEILSLLKSDFEYVVVDTGAGLDDATLTALDHATDIVFLAAADVASVRAVQKTVEVAKLLGFTDRTWHFALNRSNTRGGLSIADIETTVGMRVDVHVPTSRAVASAMNQGRSLVEVDNRNPAARAIAEFADRFLPAEAEAPRRSLFRRSR